MSDVPSRLAGADLVLTSPGRVSYAYSVLVALDQTQRDERSHKPTHLILCAALGLCWHRVRSRLAFDGDVLSYGLRVIDLLLGPDVVLAPGDRPASLVDLLRAGRAAVELLESTIPTLSAIKEEQAFTGPRSDGSIVNGSRSNAGGDGSQDGSLLLDAASKSP